MNGYEFVVEMLAKSNNDVAPLVELANKDETDWIEFKASSGNKQIASNDEHHNIYDYRFHVTSAFYALANGIGGAVIIGLNDDGKTTTSLIDSGYEDSDDKFLLHLVDSLYDRPNGWKTQAKGTWKCINPDTSLFRILMGRMQNDPVVIVLIQPRKTEDSWFEFEHINKNKTINKIPRRTRGNVGQTSFDVMSDDEKNTWWKNRDVEDLSPQFKEWLKNFSKKTPGVINGEIQGYFEALQENKGDILKVYTPIDAVQLVTPEAKKKSKKKINTDKGFAKDENWLIDKENSIDEQLSILLPKRCDSVEMLQSSASSILLGEPGAGKSTCLLKIALNYSYEWKPGKPWGLLVSLCEYTGLGIKDLLLKKLPGLDWVDIEDEIASGKITLFLDALNECPSLYYDACSQEIHSLITDYPNAKIQITSRISHNPTQLSLPSFELLPMGKSKQLTFLTRYLGEANAIDTLDLLYQQPNAELIGRSPILLRIVAWVCKDGNDLPKGLVKLYQSFIESWYMRETQKDTENGAVIFGEFGTVLEALARLAFVMRSNGFVSCKRDFAIKTLLPLMSEDEASRFISRYSQGLILEVNNDYDTLHFSHETIQEYLTAEFLSSYHETGLTLDDKANKHGNWAMPLVFAFEILDNPSEQFVHSAWSAEPLLVAAAMRNTERLSMLPIKEDNLWLSGVLKALKGQETADITRNLVFSARLPPKHKIPGYLLGALRSLPFWYALQSHEDGENRINHLKELILDHGDVWLEVIPDACAGQPSWLDDLSIVQQLIIGKLEQSDISLALEHATVSELCALLRYRIIPAEYFRKHWKEALFKSDDLQLEMDLISLLRTNEIKPSQFNSQQTARLKKVGDNWNLSPRLLRILVRSRIVSSKEVREKPGRIDNIISKISPMNAVRLAQTKVLSKKDITPVRLNTLIKKIETLDDARRLMESELVKRSEIPDELMEHIEELNRTSKHQKRLKHEYQTLEARDRARIEVEKTLKENDELIKLAGMSSEQKALLDIRKNMEDKIKQKPNMGFHSELAKILSNSIKWPTKERKELVSLAADFYQKYASKKKRKEYKVLVNKIQLEMQ